MSDYISEAEAIGWDDGYSVNILNEEGSYSYGDTSERHFSGHRSKGAPRSRKNSKKGSTKYPNPNKGKRFVNNKNRYRCLTSGCNPKLYGENSASKHSEDYGHRTAKWPVRSTEGKRKAEERNRNGYYDKYNVDKPLPSYLH